jgi:hypothetical protein
VKPETKRAMEMLYYAKVNLPNAADSCDLTHKECKIIFNAYCSIHPPNYVLEPQIKLDR